MFHTLITLSQAFSESLSAARTMLSHCWLSNLSPVRKAIVTCLITVYVLLLISVAFIAASWGVISIIVQIGLAPLMHCGTMVLSYVETLTKDSTT